MIRNASLDGLRFLLASFVVVGHVEGFRKRMSLPNIYEPNFHALAATAVIGFFTLSGFLIGQVLVRELEKPHAFSYKNFLIRRIFRIWPLAIATILFSFFLFNQLFLNSGFAPIYPDFTYKLLLAFLNPLYLMLVSPILGVAVLWSIAIEEFFYLTAPWLILAGKSLRRIWQITLGILLMILLARYITGIQRGAVDSWSFIIFRHLNFEGMLLGMLAAFGKWNNWRIWQDRRIFVVVSTFWVLSLIVPIRGGPLTDFANGLVILPVILTLSVRPQLKILSSWLFKKGGEISYSIYMVHSFVVALLIRFYGVRVFETIFALVLSYLVALFTHALIEKPFLQMREKITN